MFTGAPRGLFVSPDGQWIGFVDGPTRVEEVAMTGGPAVTLATLDGPPRGAAWGPDDTIIVATGNADDRPPASRVGGWGDDGPHAARPRAGRSSIISGRSGCQAAGLCCLRSRRSRAAPMPRKSPSWICRPGRARFSCAAARHAHCGGRPRRSAGEAIWSMGRLARCEPSPSTWPAWRPLGTSVPVVTDVVTTSNGGVDAVVAGDGTLVYVSGGGATAARAAHPRVGGPPGPRDADPGAAARVHLSAALTRWHAHRGGRERSREGHLGLGPGGTALVPFTFNPGYDSFPVWTPDGRQLIFGSDREGATELFWQAADGTGPVQRLTDSPNVKNPTAVGSPDGRRLFSPRREAIRRAWT